MQTPTQFVSFGHSVLKKSRFSKQSGSKMPLDIFLVKASATHSRRADDLESRNHWLPPRGTSDQPGKMTEHATENEDKSTPVNTERNSVEI